MPVNQTGGPTAVEIIQQSFNPAVAVLGSPDVDIVCSKNRLTFVELLQPFSRLSVEGILPLFFLGTFLIVLLIMQVKSEILITHSML